jgi:EAL domain-containing protein (putative c-di-GMP-specific phosphodiesterase class I)/CHASE2 domain-containing sensor protein
VSKRAIIRTEGPRRKLLLWAALAGLVFGLIGFGDIAEGLLRTARDRTHWHKASGDIVLVKIDNQSLRDVGRWPWPRRYHGELVDRLSAAGAKRILFDINFFGATDEANDRALADALKRSHRTILATRTISGPLGWTEGGIPLPNLSYAAQGLGTISWRYNFRQTVTGIPYAGTINGKTVPSFSALLAGRQGAPAVFFQPDYSLDPKSIPTVSASAVLQGKFDPGLIRGKEIVIGTASEEIGDQFFVPGVGRLPGVYVHVIGAETLKGGAPVELGWFPLFLLALGIGATALSRREGRWQGLILAAGTVVLTFGPAVPEAYHIFFDVTPALFVIGIIAGVLSWRRYRARGLVNPISDLPNLNALRDNTDGKKQVLIAARVLNYEEIVATLPPNSERQLIEQIVSRLSVGAPDRTLYQGDGGIFAWFEQSRAPVGNHLDALHALFRNPARVAGLKIDLAIAFGVEVGSGRSLANRLASSLVAADEAAHQGLKWKYHDPESLQNASWRLSMLSQLDEAIDRGEVWVAYQPKLDIASRRVIGAEALARWTHPEKGPIAASEFVAAAEQHNRIGKLTDFVLEKAVAAAAQINKRGPAFTIAVNLSARLLTDKAFTLRLSALLARHGLPPSRLILELTETAALADSGEALDMINRLRDLGVEIAIDDYGTGQSTLDYLKRIPASEIKIDQSFVKGIVDNRSDRLMVQSTIGLVHSLGRKVVAEGVENRDILDVLIELECDIAQGFAVGRPMSLETLTKRLSADRKRQVA